LFQRFQLSTFNDPWLPLIVSEEVSAFFFLKYISQIANDLDTCVPCSFSYMDLPSFRRENIAGLLVWIGSAIVVWIDYWWSLII
jgi:hypothetical protein